MPFSTCSQLTTQLQSLQQLQGKFKIALEQYISSASDQDKQTLLDLKQQITTAQADYDKSANTTVEVKDKKIIAKEAIIIQYIQNLVGDFKFEINNNQISKIDLDAKLVNLIDPNQVLKFINKFNSLQWLDCENNQLQSLPDQLPDSLQLLYCENNQLQSLPDQLPDGLQGLYCSNNQLQSLPDQLPDSLQRLNCSNNQLQSLPDNLPDRLQWLSFSNNQLQSLPDQLPDGLQGLYCSNNPNLITLPDLPASLRYIDIRNTPLINNEDILARLKEFQEQHPNCEIQF